MKTLRLLSIALMFCLITSWGSAQSYRTFKSADGRQMEARITRVNQDEVTIERKADQREFTVPIRTFAEADRDYIKNWDQLKRLSRDDALEVSIKRSTTRKDSQDTVSTKMETWQAGYEIAVTNETFGDFEGLELHYRIFKFDEKRAATERGQGEMERMSGKFDIAKLDRDATFTRETDKFDMSASKLKQNWYYVNGGRKKDKDELDGCWVRIYKDGKIVHETALPTAVMRSERWDAQ